MTANAGYHAYATGDVLTAAQVQYNLQNQTVMYFASSAARTTALSGVLVEGMVSYIPANGLEYYNGSAWVLVAADQTPLTTKGDLFTYSTTDARLPIGTNGQTLVANSGGTTGNAWQDPVQQNPVLNSAFQVWQRGTSVSVAAATNAYTADRWQISTGTTQACTVSRQATSDTTNLPNIQYCGRFQRNSGQTGTASIGTYQSLESINSIPFSGKAVTISFYARAGANYSAASSALSFVLYSGTGTDQNVITGFTGVTAVASLTATLTTTWQRFTAIGTVSSSSTQLAIGTGFTPVGTAGTNDYFEMTGIQIEVGSVATPFHTFSTTIQGELAACQRYYYRINASNIYGIFGHLYGASGTTAYGTITPTVSMRQMNSITSANLQAMAGTGSSYAITLAIQASYTSQYIFGVVATAASGLSGNIPYFIAAANNTSAYVAIDGEL